MRPLEVIHQAPRGVGADVGTLVDSVKHRADVAPVVRDAAVVGQARCRGESVLSDNYRRVTVRCSDFRQQVVEAPRDDLMEHKLNIFTIALLVGRSVLHTAVEPL